MQPRKLPACAEPRRAAARRGEACLGDNHGVCVSGAPDINLKTTTLRPMQKSTINTILHIIDPVVQ